MLHALCAMLFSGLGWLTWKHLRKILEITKGHFSTEAERKFVEDLIVYLWDLGGFGVRLVY